MDLLTRGLLMVISDFLSLITILMCLVAKLPQIRTIYAMKSARGKRRTHSLSLNSNASLINAFYLFPPETRHQPGRPLPGAVQLHGDDVLQLLQRLLDDVLPGIPDPVVAGLCSGIPSAQVQAAARQGCLSDCVGLFCGDGACPVQNSARVSVVAVGGKWRGISKKE